MAEKESKKTVGIFGASGFVGSRIAQNLRDRGHHVTSFSRKPQTDCENQEWVKADAFEPETYAKELKSLDSLVISIGAPPIPTFSKQAYEQSVRMNGEVCDTIIKTAERAGVKQIVLIGATMPEWAPKGYLEGKRIAEESLRDFQNRDKLRGAVIIKPGSITGTRYEKLPGLDITAPIPIWLVLTPASWGLRGLKSVGISGYLEKKFPKAFMGVLDPMVHVNQVAKAAADSAVLPKYRSKYTTFSCADILEVL